MDIQVASNFERLIFDVCFSKSNETLRLMNDLNEKGELVLKKENLNKIKESFCSESLSEDETKSVISEIYKKEGILIDPHTAVALGVANKLSLANDTVILATAHPAKFSESVMRETNIKPDLPGNLEKILNQKERAEVIPNDLNKVKDYILSRV